MKRSQRAHVASALVMGLIALAPAIALAQAAEYPARPIRLIVPFSPGSSTDLSARLLAEQLGTRFKQQIVVENKTGASGTIAADFVAKAPADGYTLLFSGPGLSTYSVLFKKLPFDPVKDLEPVSLVLENVGGVIIGGNVPATTMAEFAAYAQANPGKVNYGSLGRNTTMLLGEELKKFGNFPMSEIPYPGTPQQALALQRDDIQLAFLGVEQYAQDIQAGKLRVLAVITRHRVSSHPNVPTLAEVYPGFVSPVWCGVLAPAGTPKSIIDRLSGEIRAALETPQIKQGFARVSNIPVGTTAEEFKREIASNIAAWAEVAKFANLQAE